MKIAIVLFVSFFINIGSKAQSTSETESNLLVLISELLNQSVLKDYNVETVSPDTADVVVLINTELERQTSIRNVDLKVINGRRVSFLTKEAIFVHANAFFIEFTSITIKRKSAQLVFGLLRYDNSLFGQVEKSFSLSFRRAKHSWVLTL